MKKAMFILIMGLILSTTASADKIKYYDATTTLVDKMGKDGTASTTFYYTPAVVFSSVVETVLLPPVWFFNLFQEEK